MYRGPDEAGAFLRVVGADVAAALQDRQRLHEHGERGGRVGREFRIPLAEVPEGAEHDPVMRRVGDREPDISVPHRVEPLAAATGRFPRRQQVPPKALKPFPRHGRKQRRLVREVTVEGGPGHAQALADGAERERLDAVLSDGAHRFVQQGAAQVAMVVRAVGLACHRVKYISYVDIVYMFKYRMLTMTTLRRLWNVNAPLTATGVLMLIALVANSVGLWLDPRVIGGAPAWLKPAKFAVSTAVYALTLAWVFWHLPAWPRVRRVVGWTSAVVLVLEVGIIDLQAWRGTTSHFNLGTPLDAVLFVTMGVGILLQTLTSVAVGVALWRERFADRALGWALRLGMTLTIIGASVGGLMTRPTEAQLAGARVTHHLAIAGAHTVGAPDGGPGVPGTGWSREHGDLRVPHFVGLHAMQVLPLVVFVLRRRRLSDSLRVRLAFVAAASYAFLFAVLLAQALSGESLIAPSAITVAVLTAWILGTALAVWLVSVRMFALPRTERLA